MRDRDETGLREVLVELDADLERQERTIADRRRRVADLLARPSDVAVSDRVAGLLGEVGRAVPDAPPDALARERELLEMLEASRDAASFDKFPGQYRQMLADPEALAQLSSVAARFEALADVEPEAPQVAELAGLLADVGAAQILYQPAGDDAWQPTWSAFLATLPPAQRRCMELAWELRARVAP